jgi:thymidylate synthase
MTAYNPCQAEEGVLYPCHSITIQFYVDDQYLDMFCYNRSQDVALGVPFNIASSSLLLMTVANLTNKTPRFLHMTMGDTHIYEQHAQEIAPQLSRVPYKFPTLTVKPLKSLVDLTTLTASDFVLTEYNCHPPIKMKMVA